MTEQDRDVPGIEMSLHERAETVVREKAAASSEDLSRLTLAEIRTILHDLRVHQIELEMQNEELRQTQLERDAAQARYIDLYDEAPVGYCTISETGLIQQANLTTATLLTVARSALRNQPISRFIVREDQHIYYLHRKSLLKSGEMQSCELRMLKPDGSQFWVALVTTIVQADAGTRSLRMIIKEITTRRHAEEALRQREQYLRALLDNFPFMVWLKDEESRFLAVNKVFATSFNKPTAQSLIGCNDFDIVHPERARQYRADDQAVLASGVIKQVEETIGMGDQCRWVETYKSPIVLDGRVLGTVGFARDITKRKRTETALISAMAEAEKANRAKSRFLAAASHDLRQPLSALSIYTGLLKNTVAPAQRQVVAKMQDCVSGLNELLTDLLDLSKLEAGVVSPSISNFSIEEMFAKLASAYAPEAELKGLRLRYVPSDLTARTDLVLFRRTLGNLIENAVRHTEQGAVLIACRRRQGKTWVEVRDSGIGIPVDKTDVIFEEFRQLDESRTSGSGLGLAIVAKTAALLGLEISVRSWPGRGSIFAIELPLGEPESVMPAAAEEAPVSRSLRIALVEDNLMVREALTKGLQLLGHQVVAAASKTALLPKLGALPPNVVVSDYRLARDETSFDVIMAVRACFGSALPALLITGDTAPELLRSMSDRGIRALHKPVDLDDLQACLEDLTGQAT